MPAELASAPAARRWLRLVLMESGGDPATIETAALLVTELLTNAVEYGTGEAIELTVDLDGVKIRCEVSDDSPQLPEVPALDPTNPRGRGLNLVDVLATRWGADQITGGGKVV